MIGKNTFSREIIWNSCSALYYLLKPSILYLFLSPEAKKL
jgi:hypothetical protein